MSVVQHAPDAPARYAVLGSPIAHSLSPIMQQAAFAAANINAAYEAFDVLPDQLSVVVARMRQQRYAGWNVTTPLKEFIVPLLDGQTVEARDIGAVNVVRREPNGRLTGHNTDGAGIVRALVELWAWRSDDARVLLLGSGPAARAIAYALRQVGVPELYCWSRNALSAAAIAPLPDTTVNLVISALPSNAEIPPSVLQWAAPEGDAVDVNYATTRSPLTEFQAHRRSDGLPLLLHQGALSFEWWTGKPAPLVAMRAALRL